MTPRPSLFTKCAHGRSLSAYNVPRCHRAIVLNRVRVSVRPQRVDAVLLLADRDTFDIAYAASEMLWLWLREARDATPTVPVTQVEH